MLSSYMVPAPGGVFISLVGLEDNAQVMYFEYPSGNISLYPMPFFGTVGLSINDDGDLLMWEEYGYDYAVAPNDGGFPDFDNLFTSSATEPLSTKGGFIVNGGDVIFQMYSGDVIYAISAASGYTEEDFIDLSGVLGSIEITVKSKPGGYDLYVAGYTSGPTELHIKPYTGCELDAPFSSCTEEDPIVMPYGAPIYSISSLLIDEDDNIFFAGSNNGEIGRVLQSNKAVEFFSLTDLNDSIISYDLDNNQNLYITSFNYIYELHQYDLLFESDGGGDPGGTELSETHIIAMSWSSNPSPDGAPALIAGEELLVVVEVYDPINPGSIPTGYVALRMDDVLTVLDILELDENGMVTFSIRPNPGFHFIHAYYLGDDTYDTSQSVNHTLRVYSIATFTTLETSQNPVVKGDSFTLTAHVELPNYTIPDDSPVEFSGYVRFAVGTIDLGWELVDLNGDVSITVNTSDNPVSNLNLNEGVHHIRAHYLPFWDGFNPWLRVSSSETLFQSVVESGEGGESSEGSDIPPEGGEGGASDFAASIKGRDKVTGSISETKIGSILEWVMDYNNLGPNSNAAVTYFPIRENQEFVVGSIQAPPNWIITYSQDQTCDESTFTYTPVGADGTTDPAMRCVRFQNDRVNVPPTRSDLRYITTAADFSELNVASLGGIDVYKVVPYNNKIFYFNHHWTVTRMEVNPTKTMFCFDLEINDTCVSQNSNIVYPLSLGLNGWSNKDDEYISSKTSFEVNAEVVGDKMYIPMTDMNSPDPDDNGHGFMCWDLSQDYYCNIPGFTRGAVSLNTTAFNAWGWGNIGDIEYNPDMQELYATSVGPNEGRMVILCFSLVTNTPCVGQPYELGTFTGYDPGYGSVKYQASTGRIYSTSGGNVGNMDRQIQCLIASTKEICPDFPEGGVQILPNKRNQQIFYNANNDEICAMLYSDHEDFGPTSPRIYCYDLDAETFYDYLPNMQGTHFANEMFHDLSDQYPGRLYYMAKWDDTVIMCWDIETGEQCEGWEDGIASNIAPFDDKIYTFYYATAVTAVTTATVVATSAVAAGSGVGQIFGIFLGFLTPKRKKYWGVIVDELTSKPIAFASITLSVKAIGTDNQMNSTVVAQAVSDLDGRYRLNTDRRDEFYLEVKASGYQPFTKFIKMANPLASEEDIVYDVPLRRLDAKPNIFKQLINYRKKNLIGFARGVLLVSSVLGFIFTIYSQINFPTKLNWVLLVIYILVFVISFYPTIYQRIQKRGKVVDMDANLPIPGAVVRIYDEKQQIALSLTNTKGEARFDLPSGEYSILASKRGYIMISEEGKNLIKAVVKREGYLDRNILMRATAEAPAQPAAQGVLENPFS